MYKYMLSGDRIRMDVGVDVKIDTIDFIGVGNIWKYWVDRLRTKYADLRMTV